jgi:hypothetical protein
LATAQIPDLANYSWPPRGGDPEFDSLQYQSGLFSENPGREPTEEELSRAFEKIKENYPKTIVPHWFENPAGITNEEIIKLVSDSVNLRSNPGVPWLHFGATKADVIKKVPELFCDTVRARLKLLIETDPSQLPEDPVLLVQRGFCDPVKIHIKNEPHSAKKMLNKRYRLISVVSMADEVIERMFAMSQNMAEILMWLNCPSVPGIGFTDTQSAQFYDSLKELLKELASSDVSGWDWRFRRWMYKADAKRRCFLASHPNPKTKLAFDNVVHNRLFCLSWSLLILSDGRMFAQLVPGIMKSGSYITSSTNSFARVIAAYIIGALWAIAMGDDCVEQYIIDAVAKYLDLGILVTEYEKYDPAKGFNFCSHDYIDGVAYPTSWLKTLFRFLSGPMTDEYLFQFKYELRHCPELERCLQVIEHCRTAVQKDTNEESKISNQEGEEPSE